MLETIIIILLVLWLLGALGRVRVPALSGNLVHIILVIAVILIIFRLMG
ncbi:MAG: lmo0937 family membrane protein [Anaerolineales bacterium]|nr:lmo0937 family membrane protein [Anaerolineales bacterium]MCW5854689.1 lmo0937 family membrane protein [Anaerolineales bacterium]